MNENILDLDWLTPDVNVRVQLFGKDGELKEEQLLHNIVTNAGKDAIAQRIKGTTPAIPSHMAVGTGAGGTAASTTLTTEIAASRTAFTGGITGAAAVLTMETTFAAGVGTGAITEAGVFNNTSGGTMYMYATFSVINKGAADTLKITWTLSVV